MAAALIFAALFGLAIGSFLNVVIWRLPRGESLSHPGSHCPKCETPIKPYDNVPVVGWLMLRGKCRSCGAPISARYPLVEAATGALYVLVVAVCWDDLSRIVLGIMLVTLLVPVTMIDLDVRRIPDKLTFPFAVAGVLAVAALDTSRLPEALIAGVAAFAFFYIAAVAKPGGMGFGDVKLAGVLGIYLGRAVAPGIFIGLVSGIVIGVVVIGRVGVAEGRRTKVPFGPSLALGGLIGFLVGDSIVDSYLDSF
ncbi:prepilin peptidase [Paraconexibacter antarcticus]|uniref:Prepilin peptidase n=1 Tax=Paraconexibacter antarcticus TaxID=2949664 RepID=A0ABY5DNW5_9ACTN|nr:A24 family peptidase [Paraconexibacter antarcticus]UTI62551.1 prepilin peptidase [Paraconexibacter antarcticus]